VCVCACVHACVHTCLRACVHACMRACLHACMCVSVWCVCVCVTHVYVCVFIFFQLVLSEFVMVEMLCHTKALEMFSSCYDNLTRINELQDLEVAELFFYPNYRALRYHYSYL